MRPAHGRDVDGKRRSFLVAVVRLSPEPRGLGFRVHSMIEDRRIGKERNSQGDAPLHAARESADEPVGREAEFNRRGRGVGAVGALGTGTALKLEIEIERLEHLPGSARRSSQKSGGGGSGAT